MKKRLRAVLKAIAVFILRILPINKRKIVFSSYYGRGYGDNPKYIAEELLDSSKRYKLIWLIKNDAEKSMLPSRIKAVKTNSIRAKYHLSTAKIWIDNCRKSFYYKKENQFYMQTWHGFALKRIEKDAQENLSVGYVECAIRDSKNIDVLISDSKHMTEVYKKCFWYDGKIVEWGSPRNDIIVNASKQKICYDKVCRFYNVNNNRKIILYAPTFRSNRSLEPYSIDLERIRIAFEKKFSSAYIVVVRLHPNISEKSSELPFKWSDNIVDASEYHDMQELLAASDIVISDYSSLMFDFALSNKPCFQFATDIEDYKKDRNFYFKLDDLPFPLAQNNDELVSNIENFNLTLYQKQIAEFFDRVGMNRKGNASLMCVKFIEQVIEK